MTAIRHRRTRGTALAFAAAVAGLLAVVVLGVSGVRSLSDSTAGRRAPSRADIATQRLPFTATALVGVVDEDARLTSVAIWVLEPTGVGGSIVTLAATSDSSSGTLDTLSPLAAVFETDGAEAFLAAAERLSGLSFDVVEVVDETRLARLISPLGDLTVVMPVTVRDGSSGEEWEAGELTLSSPAAARALTASDAAVADWLFEPARAAVWKAVAERVGAGVGSIEPIASDRNVPVPATLDQFVERLVAAPVEFRSFGFRPIDADRVAEQLSPGYVGRLGARDVVVAHDRAEMLLVFGAIAPGRLGAPLDAPVFRVVAPFPTESLDEVRLNQSDVLKRAIDRLLFAQANVVSVADLTGSPVPDVTRLEVADPAVIDAVTTVYEPLFGEIEVVPAEVRIDGIDIEVTLGQSFLEQLRGESSPDVAGSEDDESSDDQDGTSDDG